MVGFRHENISNEKCILIHQCDLDRIEAKLDFVIEKLNALTGIKGFAMNVFANITGSTIDFRRR